MSQLYEMGNTKNLLHLYYTPLIIYYTMNNFPSIELIYDRRKKANKNKEAIIEIRITYDYKQKYISTGIKVLPKEWKNKKVVGRKDYVQINEALEKMKIDIRKVILDMMNEGRIDIFSIPQRLKYKKETSFIDFCKEKAEVRKYGKTKDSQERYNRFIRSFIKWNKIKTFEDINESSIILYDKYLTKSKLKPYSKWNNYHRFLNSFILDAINEGYLKKNPYNNVKIEKDKSNEGLSKYLTPEEFERIRNTEMNTLSLERVKDLFIFQTYTCLSYKDLRAFNISNIQEINGMKVYVGNRIKTGQGFTIPLSKEALEILEKYNNVLPIISNVKYNEYLKVVAQTCSIDKPISSHWARHTGATLLLNEKKIDMKIVAKILGHSTTRITEQIYAKLLDETVVDAIKNLDK